MIGFFVNDYFFILYIRRFIFEIGVIGELVNKEDCLVNMKWKSKEVC